MKFTSNSSFLLKKSHIIAWPSLSPVMNAPYMLKLEMCENRDSKGLWQKNVSETETYAGLNAISFTDTRWLDPFFSFGRHRKVYLQMLKYNWNKSYTHQAGQWMVKKRKAQQLQVLSLMPGKAVRR